MAQILNGDKEDHDYLLNYWNHAIGSLLKKDGSKPRTIAWIDEKYPDQIGLISNLEGDDKVYFVQDFEWVPTAEDLDRILEILGIQILPDGLQYRKTFQPKPETLSDYCNAVRGFRLVSLSHGDDLLKKVIK